MENKQPLYRVGIWGYGVVGKGVGDMLDDYVVKIYDPKFNYTKKEEKELMTSFKDLDLVVIAVPTPTSSDGMSCEAKFVKDSCLRLRKINFKGVILIKSTITPFVAEEIKKKYGKVVFSPEFMGESKYYTPFWKYPDPKDMRTHMWQVFGGSKEDTDFCIEVFKRKMSVDTQYYQTDIKTASLAKYIENCFFATKVTFVNEWYDIAQTFGVNWNELRELWLQDPRINRNHTLVFPKDRGYGGKCFPKDVKAMIHAVKKEGYKPTLLESVNRTNKKIRGNRP